MFSGISSVRRVRGEGVRGAVFTERGLVAAVSCAVVGLVASVEDLRGGVADASAYAKASVEGGCAVFLTVAVVVDDLAVTDEIGCDNDR